MLANILFLAMLEKIRNPKFNVRKTRNTGFDSGMTQFCDFSAINRLSNQQRLL